MGFYSYAIVNENCCNCLALDLSVLSDNRRKTINHYFIPFLGSELMIQLSCASTNK